jgi:L-aspartate oxidase
VSSDSIATDFLVVGAGVAGLRAAIEAAAAGDVLVIAKDALEESATAYAQGGIAAALSDDDEIELHEQDTLAAGDGLCAPEAVRALVAEAPAAIEELIDWGAEFDREGSRLAFAREGAHSRSRVLHAHGDSTGREIARTLHRKASSLANVRFESFASVTDLLTGDGAAAGAAVFDGRAGRTFEVHARAVLLATGGLGRVYRETTNPDVATGDGVALAWRAGAAIADIEFVQFHPTALYVDGAPRFLLSEALRGEGAYLRNAQGHRFLPRYHAGGELAPRDVVARAIVLEMEWTGTSPVYLDLTHLDAARVRRRFPRIFETCLRYGVDITRAPAPVHPAAHYAMGGVATDLDGRTPVARLYAAGEVACAGVHGANRLASNSLLEGVVFGARAGRAMREWAGAPRIGGIAPEASFPEIAESELRDLAWRRCGILRSGEGLQEALARMESVATSRSRLPLRADYEVRNLHSVATLIARAALARRESRGAHYRTDYPGREPAFAAHSVMQRDREGVEFRPVVP